MSVNSPAQPPSIFGGLNHIIAFYRSPLAYMLDLGNTYGAVSNLKIGKQDIYLINDPDLIGQVLVEQPHIFPKWSLHDKVLARFLGYETSAVEFNSNFY